MRSLIVLVLAPLGFAVAGTATAAAPTPPPCEEFHEIEERVDKLLELGQLSLADDYLEAQDSEEIHASCVDELSDEVDTQRRSAVRLATEAKKSAQDGETAEAADLYFQALALDADVPRAESELGALLRPSEPGSFGAAVTLHDAGYTDAAQEEVVKQITEKGATDEIPPELHKEKDDDWFAQTVDDFDNHVLAPLKPDNLPWAVATVAALFALVVMALRLLTRYLTPKRAGEPWAGAKHGPARLLARAFPTRRAVRPVVRFDFDQEGADVKALAGLRDAVTTALVRDSSAEQLQTAGSGDLGSVLTEIDVGVPSVNTASKVLARLFVQRVITISMTLEPVHNDRVGASVVVTDWKGRTFGARRFHGDKRTLAKDEKADYMVLSPRVTAWLGFVLADIWRASGEAVTVAGTVVPASYESYLAGYQAQARRNSARAKHHYHVALERDPENKYAMLGIGLIDAHNQALLDNAIDMLCESRKVDQRAGLDCEHPEFVRWAQASYSAAVAYLHRSAISAEPNDDLKCAENIDRNLLNVLKRGESSARRNDRREFCAQSLPIARSLLNSIRLERNGRWPAPPAPPRNTTDDNWRDYMSARTGGSARPPTQWSKSLTDARTSTSARYNISCAYARAARCAVARGRPVGVITALEDMAMLHLRKVVADKALLKRVAAVDAVFKMLQDRRQADFDNAIGKKPVAKPDGWKVLRVKADDAA